ncbi:MAG TPA: glycosyltransferase family 2 protein [bacterium]|nr:glycosyltransferase family 2 protein [bacterium]HPJ71712.1 glycosyltransferase family 2 protein [bacterium]HPQ65166.1 glycosyltransferase family 2 protein [bacterium]
MLHHQEDPWYKPSDLEEAWDIFQKRQARVTVVIPTRNEGESLGDIIEHCRPYADELLVVDGHSRDNTREVAEGAGVRFILDHGKGKGDGIRTAIAAADGDVLVFIDADYSHRPADIPRLVAPILKGEADHVVGSRPKGGSDELHGDVNKFMRMIGSDIITLGINYRFNVRLSDSQNGFRAIRTAVARDLGLRENITTIEQEMTIKTLARGYRLVEVPAHEYARRFGESKIKLSIHSLRYLYSWIKYLLFPR